MNNRRRQKIKTYFWLKDRKFRKMTEEEQDEVLKKFWEKYNLAFPVREDEG